MQHQVVSYAQLHALMDGIRVLQGQMLSLMGNQKALQRLIEQHVIGADLNENRIHPSQHGFEKSSVHNSSPNLHKEEIFALPASATFTNVSAERVFPRYEQPPVPGQIQDELNGRLEHVEASEVLYERKRSSIKDEAAQALLRPSSSQQQKQLQKQQSQQVKPQPQPHQSQHQHQQQPSLINALQRMGTILRPASKPAWAERDAPGPDPCGLDEELGHAAKRNVLSWAGEAAQAEAPMEGNDTAHKGGSLGGGSAECGSFSKRVSMDITEAPAPPLSRALLCFRSLFPFCPTADLSIVVLEIADLSLVALEIAFRLFLHMTRCPSPRITTQRSPSYTRPTISSPRYNPPITAAPGHGAASAPDKARKRVFLHPTPLGAAEQIAPRLFKNRLFERELRLFERTFLRSHVSNGADPKTPPCVWQRPSG